MPLNTSQQKAVKGDGIQLIIAGPGSGKTRVITEKILYIIKNGVNPNSILALTFSDKAATEMLERLERHIDPSDITAGTFHSFCLDVLRDNVLDSGISFASGIISRTNQLVWGLRNIDTFGFEEIEIGNNATEVVESIIDGISAFRDELITAEELQEYIKRKDGEQLEIAERTYLNQLNDLLKVYKAYGVYKRAERLLDFDDMIHEASALFDRKPTLLQQYRDRYTHILVDEFQDTNYAQLYLINRLAGDNVCVVGDDDQSIYRFRGAYLTSFNDFKKRFTSCKETLLNLNYRNSGNILACALQLMSSAPNREEKPLVTHNADGEKVIVARCENEQAEAQFVWQEIERMVGKPFIASDGQETTLTYRDIAVLSRRRVEGVKFHDALRKRGIPCEFVGEVDFFSTAVIRDALAYLHIIENPLKAGVYLNRILKLSGITEVNVQRLNACAERLAWDDDSSDFIYECMLDVENQLDAQVDHVREVTRTIEGLLKQKDRLTLAELVYDLLVRSTDLYKRSLHQKNWRDAQLLNKLYEIAQEYESITKHPSVTDFLDYLDLLSGFQIELEEPEETDSVKVMTVHQSKGTEFKVIFIVDAATNRFPLRYQQKPFYVPNDLAKGLKTGDDEKALYEQEERRLFFVAMTRAEKRLYLTYAERYGQNVRQTKPSKFLDELQFEVNPRIEIKDVCDESVEDLRTVESAVEQAKTLLQEQAIRAIQNVQPKTAIQKIIELEKLRILESGGSLDDFEIEIVTSEDSDTELRRLFEGKHTPLISEDHHFSASALQTFNNCPMQYKFSYILRVPTAGKTYFNLGGAVHEVIENLTRQELEGISPTKEQALAMLEQFWSSDSYASKTKEREDIELAERMIDTYLAWQSRNENEVFDVEMKFAFDLRGRIVKGFIDRVERTPEGHYIVIDFKTGYQSETKNSIKENIQMNVYCLAILEKFGALPRRASLFYVKPEKMVHYFPDSEQLETQKMRLQSMIDEVLQERFPGKPAYRACRFCDYEALCEEKETKNT
jgi:DNA helicase-2/ATP-dependent DNA helicase PcrA